MAGKTGTAQVRGQADTSLFAAYGPARQPGMTVRTEAEIAIAVVLEEAGFGSTAAAPITRAILEPFATGSVPTARTFDELDREQTARLEQLAAEAAAAEAGAGGDDEVAATGEDGA